MDQPALDGADSVADAPTEPPPEQRVAWAELFFDLIWVFAVTQIATALAGAHDIGEAARLMLLFMPLWWGWVGATLLANRAGDLVDRALGRVALFSVAGCGLLMSVAVGGAFGDRALVFAAGYVVLRLLLWAFSCRLPGGSARLRLEPFAVAAFVAAPLFLLGAFLDGPWRIAAWTAAALIELIAPRVLPAGMNHVRIETAHLPERFGLFLIIALGETVVAVGGQAAGIDLDGPTYAAFALAFLIIVLLWWTYFHYGAPAVRHSLEHSPEQARIVTDVFSYAHLIYVTAIIMIAVGLKKLLAYPLSVPHSFPELLLAPGVALYLFGFCYARWRMFGAATLQRSAAALACCAIAVAAPLLPAIATAALVLAVLLALNGYEAWIVTTHRPLPLLRLPRIARRETQL
ncbi:low temperature requirement protein LtrA [Rhodococcus sp. PvR044]|uniref:low temperature requirement protein A n=1 Tax=unclassified Rhodococcus (in: high G+C Gram-positive bacteria) TaxID=192944 RepID=UPI001AE98F3B|nr:low temperature requirement protein A [Rhodococcus sp. PvR099]MBP1161522.1 low temperature requirement protein LtrA [Rhodococcus sp. PvR099]